MKVISMLFALLFSSLSTLSSAKITGENPIFGDKDGISPARCDTDDCLSQDLRNALALTERIAHDGIIISVVSLLSATHILHPLVRIGVMRGSTAQIFEKLGYAFLGSSMIVTMISHMRLHFLMMHREDLGLELTLEDAINESILTEGLEEFIKKIP